MGQSTNAILAFGFDLGEELSEPLQSLMGEHESDTDEVLAADAGITLPQYESGCDYKAYSAAKDAGLAQLKIDMIPHCSGEYTMYFLAARGSDKKAFRGDPCALDADDLDAGKFGQETIDAMRAFCERHSIEWQEPKWHIFSMWN